jgi:hypothetical protein
MNITGVCTRDLLLRSLRDHDTAAKNNMKIATEHLKRGYEISRELERIESTEFRGSENSTRHGIIHSDSEVR